MGGLQPAKEASRKPLSRLAGAAAARRVGARDERKTLPPLCGSRFGMFEQASGDCAVAIILSISLLL
ncbi:MAG: hypothetical protein P4M11_12840 [Candidatus Pacebacteria bacterium]|nr:hypothetical protein [Candidatus Paceibacterota bacterium]